MAYMTKFINFLNRLPRQSVALSFLVLSLFIVVGSHAQTVSSAVPTITGEMRLWHKITLTFDGPNTSENANPNPFTDYRMDVTFTHGNKSYLVPGYYAADGDAANSGATSGNKWQVHFTPDEIGTWSYDISFVMGSNVAINGDAGSSVSFDGSTGTFDIQDTDKTGKDFRSKGILRYVGKHHLQFAGTGEYFLKNGADSPENFLAYADFDGTYDTSCCFIHEYAPHILDWNEGDPQWSENRGRAIIGAINYLGTQNVNSVYMLTYNIDGGDGGDTWPWTSHTERNRFDVSKLAQWEIVFSHMTSQGIQLHFVTQEIENDNVLGGSSGLNDIRKLYYRELVARFSHQPVLQWNIGEENRNSVLERLAFAEYIRKLDPYNHPIAVHTLNNSLKNYDGLFGSPYFDATSIQGEATNYNLWAIQLRLQSESAGHAWVVYGDEQGPAVEADMSNVNQLVRDAMWGNLLGGGAGAEWYFGYQSYFGDIRTEDWRIAEPLWIQAGRAVEFFHTYVPFDQMRPDNGLLQDKSTPTDSVLAKPGDTYVILLRQGTNSSNPAINLQNDPNNYLVSWFDPRGTDGLLTGSVSTLSGGIIADLGDAPHSPENEWVVLLKSENSNPPVVTPPPDNTQIQIDKLILVEADTNTDIMELTDGAVININELPTQNLFIRADTNSTAVQSVLFGFNDIPNYALADTPPFTTSIELQGANLGKWTISATPFDAPNASGTAGTPLVKSFEFTDEFINQPPQVTNIASQISMQGLPVSLQILASEPQGSALTYQAANLPDGLVLNADTGMITGTPTTIASSQVIVTVSDPENLSTVITFSWYIIEDSSKNTTDVVVTRFVLVNADTDTDIMELTSGAVIDINELPTLNLNIRADTGLIVPTNSIRFGLNDNANYRTENTEPFVLGGDENGNYNNWRPDLGTYIIKATPYSEKRTSGIEGATYTLIFELSDGPSENPSVVNEAPTVVSIVNQVTEVGTAVNLPVQATDAEGEALSYTATGLPAGLQIDYISGLISGTSTTSGDYPVIVNVKDTANNVGTTSFQWTVTQPVNQAPTVINPGLQTTIANTMVSLAIQASDAEGEALSYTATGLPTGLQIDYISGLITGTPTTSADYAVQISVFDSSGTSSDMTFVWSITPDPNQIPVADSSEITRGSTALTNSPSSTVHQSTLIVETTDTKPHVIQPSATNNVENPTPDLANQNELRITQFVLINADTNSDIAVLTDGMTIELSSLPTHNVNIRVDVSGPVKSVEIVGKNGLPERVENQAPYTLVGDSNGHYNHWKAQVGSYTVTATPHDNMNADGNKGPEVSIKFKIV